MEKVQSTISQRIMSIIDEKGMSQSQLSKLIGVPQTTLNRQLSSSTTPKATIVSAVLKQFPEISPEWLLTGSGSRQRVANNTRAVSIPGNGTINKHLHRLQAGLTTYWARHSWATIAASLDIPKETISAALGHQLGSTITSIYIDFDQAKVDRANRQVIDYILSCK